MKPVLIFISIILLNIGASTDSPKYMVQLDENEGIELIKHYSKKSLSRVKRIYIVEDSIITNLKEEFHKILNVKSSHNTYVKQLDNYAYQIIGIRLKKNNYIYVSAFYIGDESPEKNRYKNHWRNQAIKVFDGGNSYWRILYNIENNTFSELQINGPGPKFL